MKIFNVKFAAMAMGLFLLSGCNSSSQSESSTDNIKESSVITEVPSSENTVPQGESRESFNQEIKNRYETRLKEISGAVDTPVFYEDGRYIWYNLTTPWGYSSHLSVYDGQADDTAEININKTPSSDDMMTVHSITEHNGKITVILEENRNSNGWVEGTYVWTIDCSNRNWKCVAEGVAGAEIINNGSAVKITEATIKNPDDPTFMQEYSTTTKTINL